LYKPQGIPLRGTDVAVVSLDEFEALRLCDMENLDQQSAGRQMGVSRGTVQRLLYSGRRRIVRAILRREAIAINLQESEASNAGVHPHQRRCRTRRRGE